MIISFLSVWPAQDQVSHNSVTTHPSTVELQNVIAAFFSYFFVFSSEFIPLNITLLSFNRVSGGS